MSTSKHFDEGVRAAAAFVDLSNNAPPPPCPYLPGSEPDAYRAWHDGYESGRALLAQGLDAAGRTRSWPPQLCSHNPVHVCVCGPATRRACRGDDDSVRGVLARVLRAVATRLEG